MKTLGPAEGGAIAAMARGSFAPDVAAQRLLEMEAMHTTKTEKIADLMKGLRSQAAQDLVSRASDPWGSDAEKQEMLKNPQAAADKLAREYTAGFKTSYDNARGETRSIDYFVPRAPLTTTPTCSAAAGRLRRDAHTGAGARPCDPEPRTRT